MEILADGQNINIYYTHTYLRKPKGYNMIGHGFCGSDMKEIQAMEIHKYIILMIIIRQENQ